MQDAVLIISTAVDVATDAVTAELDRLGSPFIRIDSEQFPFAAQLSFTFDDADEPSILYISPSLEQHEIRGPRSLWYRRVRAPSRPETMDHGVYDFCLREARTALIGSAIATDCRAMSRPEAIWQAEFKPFQLAVARSSGMRVPQTMITNCPEQVRSFYDRVRRRMVIKPVRTGYLELRGEPRAIYTSRFMDEHIDELEDARLAPSIYQEFIAKTHDIRVTYVGGRIFAAAIHSQTDEPAMVDWRRTENPDLPHSNHTLPGELTYCIHGFMERLGLQYGALDFAQTADGQYVFLEVNPNGQWLWLDRILDLGITTAVAEWLIG